MGCAPFTNVFCEHIFCMWQRKMKHINACSLIPTAVQKYGKSKVYQNFLLVDLMCVLDVTGTCVTLWTVYTSNSTVLIF